MKRLSLLVALSLASCAPALAQSAQQIEVSGSKAEPRLGLGFDAVHGTILPYRCVDYAAQPPEKSLNSLRWTTEAYDSYSSFAMQRGGAFSARGGGIFWSVNAAGDYWRASMATDRAVYLRIRSEVTVDDESTLNAKVSADAAGRTPADFLQRCGTHYVARRYLGGHFEAVIEIEANDDADKTRLYASLGARAGSIAVDASFFSSVQKTSGSRRTRISVFQSGGTVSAYTNYQALEAAADNFTRTVQAAPVARGFMAMEYPSRPASVGKQTRFLESLSEAYIGTKAERNRLAGVKEQLSLVSSPGQMPSDPKCDAANEKAAIDDDLRKLDAALADFERMADECQSGVSRCDAPAAVRRSGYREKDMCRVQCSYDISSGFDSIRHGQEPTWSGVCHTGRPGAEHDMKLAAEFGWIDWCPTHATSNAPHEAFDARVDAGGTVEWHRTGIGTPTAAAAVPPFDGKWRLRADDKGDVALQVIIRNEQHERAGRMCRIRASSVKVTVTPVP